MFSSNGMYLITFVFCVIAGYNLNKIKKRKIEKEKAKLKMQLFSDEMAKVISKEEDSDTRKKMLKEFQQFLEKEKEFDVHEEKNK